MDWGGENAGEERWWEEQIALQVLIGANRQSGSDSAFDYALTAHERTIVSGGEVSNWVTIYWNGHTRTAPEGQSYWEGWGDRWVRRMILLLGD